MALKFEVGQRAPLYNDIPQAQWTNWMWQMQNALTTQSDFEEVFNLTPDEVRGFTASKQLFKVSTTPYYAGLAVAQGGNVGPIRRILMPLGVEAEVGAQQMLDPLDEYSHTPAPRIVHRYSDRVLFLITDTCSVYCRFCTRKRFTGSEQGIADSKEYHAALEYIRRHPGIREVIFSGGDPLTLSNKLLGRALKDIRAIEHVEIIRVGTRMPVVCPMRIDDELVSTLRESAPVFLMTHFSHPKELTQEAATAIGKLVDGGIPVMNQMVLLNGVNNDAAVIQALSRRLLYLRAKPYYMFQCDPSEGTDHLRTTVDSGEALVRELWGHLSGLAMPNFSLDIPSGAGKTTLTPNYLVKKDGPVREFIGWDGKRAVYRDPKGPMLHPSDAHDYIVEWELLKAAKMTAVKPVQAARTSPQIFSANYSETKSSPSDQGRDPQGYE